VLSTFAVGSHSGEMDAHCLTVAPPSPCSPSRRPAPRAASPALTAARVDGRLPSCRFGERSRPMGRIAHQNDMAATCRAAETQSSRRDRSEAEERRSRLMASRRCGPRCVTPSEYVARVLPCNSERIASPSLRGSEATKQSRLSRVKAGTDCFTYVLRTKSDESCKKPSLDRFVAALPRDDGARLQLKSARCSWPPPHARPR
jgi:hypothetical protein